MIHQGEARHITVVGAGITGLAAAWELSRSADPPRVTILEAGDAVGGKLKASPFAGLPSVDEGADAFLARVPWGRQLCDELGLTDLVSPASSTAYVWSSGRLHAIPDGLVLGVPAGLGGLIRSRLLSPRGVARAGLDLVRPRTPTGHDNLGRAIRDRFGAQVLERLVDPLVGSINAGDADHLSLAAATPQIAEPAARSRSLLLALRTNRRAALAAASTSGPVFLAPRDGMASLAATLAERLTEVPTTTIRTGTAVTEIARDGHRWRVNGEPTDGVIVTVPAYQAAPLLAALCPNASALLAAIPYAGVVMVSLHVSGDAAPPGSGYLVPKPVQHHVTAASFASHKWVHWQPAAGGSLLRVSLGRHDREAPMDFTDDIAIRTALDEVGRHIGTTLDLISARVGRWPRSFPQYLPHHLQRVQAVDDVLGIECPNLLVVGAAHRGLGVPACIRQGREAALRLLSVAPSE